MIVSFFQQYWWAVLIYLTIGIYLTKREHQIALSTPTSLFVLLFWAVGWPVEIIYKVEASIKKHFQIELDILQLGLAIIWTYITINKMLNGWLIETLSQSYLNFLGLLVLLGFSYLFLVFHPLWDFAESLILKYKKTDNQK